MRVRVTGKKRVLTIVATVVVLAVVILVAASLSTPKRSAEKLPELTKGLSDPYDEALKAERSGDTTKAITLLERIVVADPNNAEARDALKRLRDSQPKPGTDTGNPPADPGGDNGENAGPQEPDDSAYRDARSDLRSLLPASVAGYAMSAADSNAAEAQLTLAPSRGSAQAARVSVVSMVVRDAGSVSAARAFVDGHGAAYPGGLKSLRVGVVNARAGTDRERLAAISLARGRFAFEVLLTVTEGDPADRLDEVVRLASLIPATQD